MVPIGRNIERIQRKYQSKITISQTIFTKSMPRRMFVTNLHSLVFSPIDPISNAGKSHFSTVETGSATIVSPEFPIFDM